MVWCADPLPAILNLKIAGEAVLGGKLTACGHSVYGSSLCYFQVSPPRAPTQAAPAAAPRSDCADARERGRVPCSG